MLHRSTLARNAPYPRRISCDAFEIGPAKSGHPVEHADANISFCFLIFEGAHFELCPKAINLASQAKMVDQDGIIERKEDRIIRLEKLLADFKRALYGAKSEKANPDQYHLALEDIETAMAVVAAATGGHHPRPRARALLLRYTRRAPTSRAALRAGLILCQKVRFFGMKKKKFCPGIGGLQVARASSFSAIPHKAGY